MKKITKIMLVSACAVTAFVGAIAFNASAVEIPANGCRYTNVESDRCLATLTGVDQDGEVVIEIPIGITSCANNPEITSCAVN